MRLEAPRIWGDPALAAGVAAALARLDGVETATASAVTGRALLRLSAPPADWPAFLATVAAAVEAATPVEPQPMATRGASAPPASQPPLRRDWLRVIGGTVVVGSLGLVRLLGGPAVLAAPPVAAFTVGATLIIGLPTFIHGIRPLLRLRAPEIDTLITTATAASLLVGEAATGLIVVWLIALGELVEELTLHRTRRAISELLAVGEEWAWVVAGGEEALSAAETRLPPGESAAPGAPGDDVREVRVRVEDLEPGAVVVIHAGEKIPVDGVVLQGSASVNEAPITGESLPVFRNPGDEVYAGTLLLSGSLLVRATLVGADTAIGRIIQLVEEAREVQAPIQRLADRFSRRIVPFSFLLAGGVFLLTGNVLRSMTILVIACPCAAGLATPTAVSAAIARAARRGILIKGGLHLETAGSIDAVVFDKTGTLTTGAPRVTRVIASDDAYTPERLLALAASGELHSQHPLAAAVLQHTAEREIEVPPHSEYEIIVGHGVRFAVDGTRLVIGSRHLLDDFAIPVPAEVETLAQRLRGRGETVLWVAEAPGAAVVPEAHLVRTHPEGEFTAGADTLRRPEPPGSAPLGGATGDGEKLRDTAEATAAERLEVALHHASAVPGRVAGRVIGLIGVSDTVRPEAAPALAALREAGVREVHLITGDSPESASIVAAQLGIPAAHVHAEALPDEKYRLVRHLQAAGFRVALVGDGTNDAPALAAADLGVAMGHGGADVALEAADVALASDDVRHVADTIHLSRRTMRLVRQNFAFSLGVNGAGVVAGAFGLLSPLLAALLHNLSTVAVVLNSGRLLTAGDGPSADAPSADARPADGPE